MSDIQSNDISGLIALFRTKAAGKADSSARTYRQAIAGFESYLNSAGQPPLTGATLTDWIVDMTQRGLTLKTALLYFDIIAALYKEALGDGADPRLLAAFADIKTRARQLPKALPALSRDDLCRYLALLRLAPGLTGPTAMAVDLMLLSLMRGAEPVADTARLKTADLAEACAANPEVAAIVGRRSSPRRSYLFDLSQSRLSPRQLESSVTTLIAGTLRSRNLPLVGSIDNTLRLLWAAMALRCGVGATDTVSLLGAAPAGIPALALCPLPEAAPDTGRCQVAPDLGRRQATVAAIAPLFVDNPLRWYAMKLRTRVDFDDLTRRLATPAAADTPAPPAPELFYPYDEIARRINKKLVFDRKPVIKDIVFFRARHTDIHPLMSRIGDLAWCYTTSGSRGGDYAPIPAAAFATFQKTIGHFTADCQIAPIGGFEPLPGERVIVVGGLMDNFEFEVDRQTGPAVYQLMMIGGNGIQWRTSSQKGLGIKKK